MVVAAALFIDPHIQKWLLCILFIVTIVS
jgi:hypothetical protein